MGVFRNAASIRATVGQHSGKEEDHENWMDTLKSEFVLNWFGQIVADEESVWQAFKASDPKKAEIQSRVMISVLNWGTGAACDV